MIEDNPGKFIAKVRYWKRNPNFIMDRKTTQQQKSFSNREDAEVWLDNFRNNEYMIIRHKSVTVETIGERLRKARERAYRRGG